MPELVAAVLEIGGDSLLECMQCGSCTAVCPHGELSPRLVIRHIALGIEGGGRPADELWQCVTCGNCNHRCPRGVDIVDVMHAARTVMRESGAIPASLKAPLASMRDQGNPWGQPRSQRSAWREVSRALATTTDEALFTCCTSAYDGRNQKSAHALLEVLAAAGVDLATVADESCCGDQAHKCGAPQTRAQLQQGNGELFAEQQVTRVVTTSPHCLDSFAATLPALGVRHYSELLDELISAGALAFAGATPLRVAYHDPCYLGRHAGIYDPPRRVLAAIPGVELVELAHGREDSLCCGGGGGGVWQESEAPLAGRRIDEAIQVDADVIATACPFCTIMLEDGARGRADGPLIRDVAELVRDAL